MELEYYLIGGDDATKEDLRNDKAKAVLELINNPKLGNFYHLETKKDENYDIVVFDVTPQIPQKPSNDIRRIERVAAFFHRQDKERPQVKVLRKEFPEVKHLYNPKADRPKRLCLTIEPYYEEQYYWTASGFLKSIFNWLSKTSKAVLHEEDQPLEEFFFDSPHRMLLPNLFFNENTYTIESDFICRKLYKENDALVALLGKANSYIDKKAHRIFVYETPAVVHSIPRLPSSKLRDLDRELEELGFCIKTKLATKLFAFAQQKKVNPNNGLFLLIRIPKKRDEDSDIEDYELQAFFVGKNIGEIYRMLGLKTKNGDVVIGDFNSDNLLDLKILALNPTPYLTPSNALKHNGLSAPIDKQISIVGLGALGSQVVDHLYRSGFYKLSFIDHDKLLPHNLSRHFLDGNYLGRPKVEGMEDSLSTIFEENSINTYKENILGKLSDEVKRELTESYTILDFSASNIVSKFLSTNVESDAPRISGFLNPDGKDSIIIKEDLERNYKLDTLELDYYRGIFRNIEFHDHLNTPKYRIGYAYNCRDVATQMSHIDVVQHSALISRTIINCFEDKEPLIAIWRTNRYGETKRQNFKCHEYLRIDHGKWQIKISKKIVNKIFRERIDKLQNETGGVLMGYINTKENIIYISDSFKSPSDSIEYPTSYIRGKNNLLKKVETYNEVTANQINYIGEWHSHPDNSRVDPSDDDKELFQWLKEHRRIDSLPPLMIIVGDNNRLNFLLEEESNSVILDVEV